jgi:hypothetical protein
MNTLVERDKEMTVGVYVPRSAVAIAVKFDDEMMHVELADGRTISVPIVWFPSLRGASPSQRANYEIGPGGFGIHWPDLDEDLSVAGLMAGIDAAAA